MNNRPIDIIHQALDIRESISHGDWRNVAIILSYELGYLNRELFYASFTNGDLKKGHLLYAGSELSDLITQAHVLAEMLGLDWEQLQSDGAERFLDKMIRLKRGDVK